MKAIIIAVAVLSTACGYSRQEWGAALQQYNQTVQQQPQPVVTQCRPDYMGGMTCTTQARGY